MRASAVPIILKSDLSRFVSMLTFTVMPVRSVGPGLLSSNFKRTGTRWTTLTQLPLAFCGGRTDSSEPVEGLIELTDAFHS